VFVDPSPPAGPTQRFPPTSPTISATMAQSWRWRQLAFFLPQCDRHPDRPRRFRPHSEDHQSFLSNYMYVAGVRERWEQEGTWIVPPLLIDRGLLAPPGVALEIVEGRTRLGILRGRMRDRQLVARRHQVWVGRRAMAG
jgi:hypothetical protein